jgi:hypothetical protein
MTTLIPFLAYPSPMDAAFQRTILKQMQPQVFACLCSKFSKNPRGQFNNMGNSIRNSTVHLDLDAFRVVRYLFNNNKKGHHMNSKYC